MIIATNVPLSDKVWFKTGGNARFFCEPTTIQEFQQAIQYAHSADLAVFILGQGANVLISDEGFDGLVIRPQLAEISIAAGDDQHVQVAAGAGVTISDLISYCLDQNILGLEEFSGIPGTVGGSVYINLHYFEFLLSHFLLHARVINHVTGVVETVDTSWFGFGYNVSRLHQHEWYLVDATFLLRRATDLEVAYARGRRAEIIRHRTSRYPSANTCGSFFRNFHPHEVTLESNGKKMIYVAYYLDKLGVKGVLSHGDALVSHQHANMIVNKGQATSTDIVQLVRSLQEKVKQVYDIVPQPECLLIGFSEYPLLR